MPDNALRTADNASPCLRISTIGWALAPACVALVLAALACTGLVEATLPVCIATFVLCTGLVWLAIARPRILARFAAMSPRASVLRDTAAIAAACLLSACALELPWNPVWGTLEPKFALIELVLIALTLSSLYFLNMRHGALPACAVAAFCLIGLAQHFVVVFKGDCILPSDLLALSTAATVAGQFRYTLDSVCLVGICCALCAIGALSLVCPAGKAIERVPRVANYLIFGVVLAGGLLVMGGVVNYGTVFKADLNYWWQLDYYQRQGFLPTFNYAMQDLKVKAPKGYSANTGTRAQEQLVAAYNDDNENAQRRDAAKEQFDSAKPNILVVMNETFADLSVMDELKCGYTGPEFFNNGLDALVRGKIAVPAYGGGTANTEYEFLTGNSLTFIGSGKHPYEMFDLRRSASIARQLSEIGYETSAVHPNAASNWNRNAAYPALGFETFVDISAFAGAPVYHNGVSDKATYDLVLDTLKERDAPQFVFDVTMQNHSGYDTGNIPKEDLPDIHPPGIDAQTDAQLNEYLACIEASDEDLSYLVGELDKLDEPTILVFFGDHHPGFSKDLNDALMGDEPDMEHEQRVHQTVYAIWSNYDIAGTRTGSNEDTCSAMLASKLLDIAGAPMSDSQKAQLGARKAVLSVDSYGYLAADGAWHWFEDDSPYQSTYEALELASYLRFESGN